MLKRFHYIHNKESDDKLKFKLEIKRIKFTVFNTVSSYKKQRIDVKLEAFASTYEPNEQCTLTVPS